MRASLFLFAIAFFLLAPPSADAARLWSGGCELQADSPGNATDDLEFGAEGTAGASKIDTTIKRSGLASCRSINATDGQSTFRVQFSLNTVSTDLYFRFYLYITTMPAENNSIFEVFDQGIDTEGNLTLNTNGTLTWEDDDSTDVGTGATVLTTGQWYRIEVNYDAGANIEVLVDGSSQFSLGANDGDGIDTFLVGMCSPGANSCGGDNSGTGDWYFDDLAVNNTSGTLQNSYPGAGSIVHMQPDSAGDGNGCSAGSVVSVDEVTPDDNTTFCNLDADTGGDILDVNTESASAAGIDSYDTITLVHVGIREAKVSAASATWNVRVKSAAGGTTSAGTNIAGSNTAYATNGPVYTFFPREYSLVSYTDPTTGVAWTPTGTNSLDNMQIGANAVDGNPDVKVSTLWALVEYLDGNAPASANTTNSIIWFDE